MARHRNLGLLVAISVAAINCAGAGRSPFVDPVEFALPLTETGSLEIAGTVVGQPRARDGIVYIATREGALTAAVPSARTILWRFEAEDMLAAGPELGPGHILVRDAANTVYLLDARGSLVFKKSFDEIVTTAVRMIGARILLATGNGRLQALDAAQPGKRLWEYQAGSPVTAGPTLAGDLVVFGSESGRLMALDKEGRLRWEFAGDGAVASDPSVDHGRLFFGTKNRSFYCLNAATGRKKWSRRLQGVPLHAALVSGRRLAVASSNSAIYVLSGRRGSILSWDAVPSRIVFEPAAAGPLILVTAAIESLDVLDLKTGRRAGQHLALGPQTAGALWASPFVILFEEAADPGRTRVAFLRSK